MSGAPDGMANGPSRSDHAGKEAQIWERPWTLEEMRQSGGSWSLAADSGLFLFLQDFSQKMLSKTHEIEKQLDSLIRDTKATDSCLHSVFNDFLMLSNTQFIENRVYDEEVEEATPKADALEKQPEQQKTREQKEAELIPKMEEAVNYGLRVLESAFEHLDIKAGNSDSEDEEVTDRVEAILEPKDLYVDRPLPYLIGSQAFMEQDDVGLGDLSSDEMSVDSDRDSVIESEDGKGAVHSDEDFSPDEDEGHTNMKKKSSMVSYEDDEEDEDEDSDIFGESDKDDDDPKSTDPSSFADELAARIKGEPANRPDGDRASLTSKKKGKGRKEPKAAKPAAAAEEEDDSDDMFKPPKMDDDDFSPFGAKSSLFSGGRGLFDDDDEGDLFSEAPKPPVSKEEAPVKESAKSTAHSAESAKPAKKIPPGGVSIFPDNSLFGSGNDSDSVESRENGTATGKTTSTPKASPAAAGGGGGGLFDDEDDEDDFFSGKSLKKSESAGQEKPKPRKAIDLFDEDDDDNGDIFSEKYSPPAPAPSTKAAVEEEAKPPEKKMPAGAISMFGPGTKSLLTEGLKRRQPSTSEESEKSEENGLAADVVKAVKQTQKPQAQKPQAQKPQASSLFSDDEDTQVFSATPKSLPKPEPTSHSKINKTPLSLFDDDEEEDLFASAAKSRPKASSAKASATPSSKAVSTSLFSDDEDQWLSSSSSSAAKQEPKTGGMKPSASAPSSLPSSLFDEDEDDLFAPTKAASQKKPQRVALLFEDEEDEDKGSFFSTKPAASPNAKTPAVDSQTNSAVEKSEEVDSSKGAAGHKPPQQEKAAEKTPETLQPPPEGGDGKKKPAGAVSLFGGINVLANKQTRSPLDGADDDGGGFLPKDSPPPNVRKEEKGKTNTVSLFDDEEEDESDWNDPIFTPSKPAARSTSKPAEERAPAKSTGVFQDEELLFSHTQQRDNDPDVDLFAASGKAATSKLSSAKPAAPGLFADDDEDDLFSSVKPKALPPKVAEKPTISKDRAAPVSPEREPETQKPAPSPVKPKEPSSRIGKLQANLMINPAVLLPGAVPSLPGAVSVLPGVAPSSSSGVSSSSLSPSPATTPVGSQADVDGGVGFDSPVQVSTLQSAHKSRAKGSVHRRPQSRAARQQAAQRSMEEKEETLRGDVPAPVPGLSASAFPPASGPSRAPASPTPSNSTATPPPPTPSPPQPPLTEISPRPSALALPVSGNAGKEDSSRDGSSAKVPPSSGEDDLFGSDGLFGAASVTDAAPAKKDAAAKKDKSNLPSIFDDGGGDLFQKVKPRSKAKASSFLADDDDDDEDIFRVSNNSTPTSTSVKEIKSSSSLSKQDIFKDDIAAVPKAQKKSKEKPFDASLFDDNIDIFADLTDTLKPKHKSKAKGETKSIFDDDMDDIFSPSTAKPVTKAPPKSKKMPPPPPQETSTTDSGDIFDDPLNALGGN